MMGSYLGVNQRPLDAVMPALPQDILTFGTGMAAALLIVYALFRVASSARDDRWLILLIAAGFTVFMEPFACFMVKAHHPAVGAYVLLKGFDVTVPLQLLFFYILYFAPTGYYLIRQAEKKVSVSRFWIDFSVILACLFGGEAVAIAIGVWFFFDYNPFTILGLPLWVALTNIAAVYAWSAACIYCLHRLDGAKRYWALIAAPFAAIAVYAPIALPTAIALYGENESLSETIPSGIISVILSLALIAVTRKLMAEWVHAEPDEAGT